MFLSDITGTILNIKISSHTSTVSVLLLTDSHLLKNNETKKRQVAMTQSWAIFGEPHSLEIFLTGLAEPGYRHATPDTISFHWSYGQSLSQTHKHTNHLPQHQRLRDPSEQLLIMSSTTLQCLYFCLLIHIY